MNKDAITRNHPCWGSNGKSITKKQLIDGEFPVVGGGVSPLGLHNIHNLDKHTILISKDGANAGFVSMYETPIFATGHALYVKDIKDTIIKKYL